MSKRGLPLPSQPFALIPKKLHLIWVGDESKRPDPWIATWRDMHPSWEFKLWGNAEYDSIPWRAKRQMDRFRAEGHWEGVADLMRYEILYRHGGVYVDADSRCVRPLDDWLLETRFFAIHESERHVPELIANGFIGSLPEHPVLRDLVNITSRMNSPVHRWKWYRWGYKKFSPWKTVGPRLLTKVVRPYCPHEATILPSVLFLPRHQCDTEERQSNLIYARHAWMGNDPQRLWDGKQVKKL